MTIDPETKEEHISPVGLEHQGPQISKGGIYYANIKLRHWIICLIQDAYPELKERMTNNPNAINILSAFIALVPLQTKGKLTPELKRKILKNYKLI